MLRLHLLPSAVRRAQKAPSDQHGGRSGEGKGVHSKIQVTVVHYYTQIAQFF
jgi:hypothetical protein